MYIIITSFSIPKRQKFSRASRAILYLAPYIIHMLIFPANVYAMYSYMGDPWKKQCTLYAIQVLDGSDVVRLGG